jgi:hypothetical protein
MKIQALEEISEVDSSIDSSIVDSSIVPISKPHASINSRRRWTLVSSKDWHPSKHEIECACHRLHAVSSSLVLLRLTMYHLLINQNHSLRTFSPIQPNKMKMNLCKRNHARC